MDDGDLLSSRDLSVWILRSFMIPDGEEFADKMGDIFGEFILYYYYIYYL
jgi:endo-1,4-beta-mannosidase